jgi:transitional endoplasmic reticulum ATPase
MASEPEHVRQLREALALSPDNGPLRQALADSLLAAGLAGEAVAEYRAALAVAPDNPGLKLGLARAFHAAGKSSHALVVVEDLVKLPDPPARALVLHARLLAAVGEVEQAVAQYRRGVAIDPAAADAEFAGRLGIRPERREPADSWTDAAPGRGREPDGGYDPTDDTSDELHDEVSDGRVRSAGGDEEDDAGSGAEVERPRTRFKDVGGMESLKEEIRLKIIHPLTHADIFKAYGKGVGGGILMYGPPGCGKTHLARATAGEVHAAFIAVGIHEVLDMWIGRSERNLHSVFERARENAPCVLFFDEVDALGASRSDMRTTAGRHLINQFLAELDGMQAGNDGVLVLGATNAPWHLDTAFRRPGRFDRIIFVPPPDAPARAAILRLLLRGKPVEDVDHDTIARKTEGFSGADLAAVVDVAVEQKLRDALRSGRPEPLRTRDLVAAAATRKPTTKEWFATAKNHALYANEGGAYDDVLKYLKL